MNWLPAKAGLIDALSFNLAALGYLALAIGLLLIINSVRFSLLQRLPVFSRWRVLGITDRELGFSMLIESLLLGLAGILCGWLLGALLSQWLSFLSQQTIGNLYDIQSIHQDFGQPVAYLKAGALGLLAVTGSYGISYFSLDRQRLVSGLDRLFQETPAQRPGWPLAVIACLALLAAGALRLLGTGSLPLTYAAATLSVLALLAVGPLVLRHCLQLWQWPMHRLFGSIGLIASRDCIRESSRIVLAVFALALAVAVANSIGIMVGSFKFSVEEWLNQQLGAELYVSAPGPISPDQEQTLLALLAPLDSIKYVSRSRFNRVFSENRWLPIVALQPDRQQALPLQIIAGDRDAFYQGGLFISEPLARKRKLGLGSPLSLATASGPAQFTVAGIVNDYGSEHGRLFLYRSAYAALWRDPALTSLGTAPETRCRYYCG